ncbi:MAG: hypothetical protein PHP88_04355 [bacterium]|nr:hypothetical protein [bacterium]
MRSKIFRNFVFPVAMIVFSLLLIGGCDLHLSDDDVPAVVLTDPTTPWTATATAATWLTTNPYASKHDGGWVYSAREDRLYAMYGQDAGGTGETLYRINPIDNTSSVATTFLFNRHGSQPVIDDTGTYIYQGPSESSNELERYNTVTSALVTLAPAPSTSTYSHAAWKNGKLWVVVDDGTLRSYNPADNTWSASLHTFTGLANVASSGPASNLIYVIVSSAGDFFSYNVVTDNVTTLDSHPSGFNLGGNGQFTWFGANTGFIYAADGMGSAPAIYDIANSTWHALTDPKPGGNWAGHATYDSSRRRLYVTGTSSDVWYYQY